MIWNLPIESLEERYSAQWNVWWPREFAVNKVEFRTIYGQTLTDNIQDGVFLDVCGTNYFKASQLMQIALLCHSREVQDSDVFFFHDLWHPGLEMLAYMRNGLGIDFKICGILHAGTYDPFDFISKCGMGKWGKKLEESWFTIVDKIFVATDFHKRMIVGSRTIDPDKISVTGLPIYFDELPQFESTKENIVVFPHRLDSEKNPQVFDRIAEKFAWTGWQFIRTKDVCKTKNEYYSLLSKAKIAVSFADQETWGIAQQEATAYGCFPLVPNDLSYAEMYPACFRFSGLTRGEITLSSIMRIPESYEGERVKAYNSLRVAGRQAIPNIITEIKGLT